MTDKGIEIDEKLNDAEEGYDLSLRVHALSVHLQNAVTEAVIESEIDGEMLGVAERLTHRANSMLRVRLGRHKVYVNPANVISIVPSETGAVVRLLDGQKLEVFETVDTLANRFNMIDLTVATEDPGPKVWGSPHIAP